MSEGMDVIPAEQPQSERGHEADGQNVAHTRLERARLVHGRDTALPDDAVRCLPRLLKLRIHGCASLRSRVTSGATVPDFSRSPAPAKPLFTMQPVRRPRRTMNRAATRWMSTSPSSILKLSSDSLPSSLRTKSAGSSLRAAKVRRVWMPSSEAPVGFTDGSPQNQ